MGGELRQERHDVLLHGGELPLHQSVFMNARAELLADALERLAQIFQKGHDTNLDSYLASVWAYLGSTFLVAIMASAVKLGMKK
jgi:hypothetical protein